MHGDMTALDSYEHRVHVACAAYRQHHHIIHRQETRWKNHPFWCRRFAASATDQVLGPSA
jgi:hypothetical protein